MGRVKERLAMEGLRGTGRRDPRNEVGRQEDRPHFQGDGAFQANDLSGAGGAA